MIARRIVRWGCRGVTGSPWGVVWGCKGVLGPSHPPPTPRLMSSWCHRLKGVNKVPSVTGRHSYLHTHTQPSDACTWRRRRRRWRGSEGLFLAVSCGRYYCSDIPGSGGAVEVKDDEAQQLEMERHGGRDGGQFYDTEYHGHFNIQDKDIGVRVNVGEHVIYELQHLFEIPRQEALRMVRSNSFLLVSDMAILQTLHFLKTLHISSEQLLRIPWILLQSADTLQHKCQILCDPHLFRTVPEGLGFCYFSQRKILKYRHWFAKESPSFPNHPNRVYYMAEQMQVPPVVVVEKVVKPKQILRMDVARIKSIIDICNKYGVHMQDLVADMWVFCHKVEVIEDRLRQAVEAGCVHPKPWICHSSAHVFGRYMHRLRSRMEVLGQDGDPRQYVSERLSCPIHEVQETFRRNRSLERMHVGLIKHKLDFLLEEGFTVKEIRSFMPILLYSEDKMRKRLHELKAIGQPFPISILCKRQQTYFNFVQRMKRAQNMDQEEEEEDRR